MKILLGLLLLCAAAGARSQEPPARLFIVHFSTGPAWDAAKSFNEQQHAQGHSQNLARLRREGALLIGARFADKGMIVLRSASEAAARAEIDKDPTVQARVFIYDIAPFQPFYEGCVTVKADDKAKCIS